LKQARVRRSLLQLGEVVHLGLGAGGVVDGEQEHTCEGEEGKEEDRTRENYTSAAVETERAAGAFAVRADAG
jgi:hypothetical protein